MTDEELSKVLLGLFKAKRRHEELIATTIGWAKKLDEVSKQLRESPDRIGVSGDGRAVVVGPLPSVEEIERVVAELRTTTITISRFEEAMRQG